MKTRQDGTWKLAMVFTLAMLGVMPSASAQPATPAQKETPSLDPRKQAVQLLRDGNRLFNQGKYAEAVVPLRAAWEINRTYEVAANLGHTEHQLGKYRDAAEHLAFSVRTTPLIGRDLDERREAVQKALAEVLKQVASVTLQVNLPGATVLVDGKAIGRAPLEYEVFVDPGARMLEAKFPGYEDARKQINAPKGSQQTVTLELAVSPPPSPPPTSPPHPPSTARPIWPLVAGAGVTVVLLASGTGLAVAANAYRAEGGDAQQQIDDSGKLCGAGADPKVCSKLEGALGQTDSFRNLAIGAFVGAGVVAVTTVVYGLLPPLKSAVPQGVMLVPMVGSHQAGAVFHAAF